MKETNNNVSQMKDRFDDDGILPTSSIWFLYISMYMLEYITKSMRLPISDR